MDNFQCYNSFLLALDEVQLLIEDAKESECKNDERYKVYNKSSILLLASKFESFIEGVVEEYIEKLNSLCLPFDKIPLDIKKNHMKHVLTESHAIINQAHKYEEREQLYLQLVNLWNHSKNEVKVKVNTSFSYGKHGANEMNKLFNNIGIEDVFLEIQIYSDEKLLLSDAKELIDFKARFSNFNNIRNKIIHQDFTPNLTYNDVVEYKSDFDKFSSEIVKKLEENIKLIENSIECQSQSE